MLVTRERRDERGSALVSVLVMMLVLTLFALTLAAIVNNTSNTVASGRNKTQARAAADAGIAAALAAFKQAEACTGPVTSTSAPAYSVTCTADTSTVPSTVTFTSTGTASDGRQARVEAVYAFTTVQNYDTKVGQFTLFNDLALYPPNQITSSTTDPAKLTVVAGIYECYNQVAANLVVEGDFYAYGGCSISGSVKTAGDANLYYGSSVGGSVTAAGYGYVNGTVGGHLAAGSYVTVDGSGSVVGDVAAAGTARSSVYGKVGGDFKVNGAVTVSYNAEVTGEVTATGTDRTYIYAKVGKGLKARGAVTVDYGGSVGGDVIAARNDVTYAYGKIGGGLKAGGNVIQAYDATVGGDVIAAGTAQTTIRGKIDGDLVAAGRIYVDYNATITGSGFGSNTTRHYVYGTINGNLELAGVLDLDYSGTVKGRLVTASTSTNNIYGTVGGDFNAGGIIYFPAGTIGGDVTLPNTKNFTPAGAAARVSGTVSKGATPARPGAPTVVLDAAEIQVSPPPATPVPSWVDYAYVATDWPGYTVITLSRSSSWCSSRTWATLLATLSAPTVIDANACSGGLDQHPTSPTTVVVRTNVVVVSTYLDLQYLNITSASGTDPRLWFIVGSDRQDVKNISGVTEGDGTIYLRSTDIKVPALLYTPRDVLFYFSTFNGSMYANDLLATNANPGEITATPIDFPVELFDSSSPSPGSGGTFSMTQVSQREVG
jgi:cytoskeletal protein CcmA (bactofilin family)